MKEKQKIAPFVETYKSIAGQNGGATDEQIWKRMRASLIKLVSENQEAAAHKMFRSIAERAQDGSRTYEAVVDGQVQFQLNTDIVVPLGDGRVILTRNMDRRHIEARIRIVTENVAAVNDAGGREIAALKDLLAKMRGTDTVGDVAA